jgi:hypothetical protein
MPVRSKKSSTTASIKHEAAVVRGNGEKAMTPRPEKNKSFEFEEIRNQLMFFTSMISGREVLA